jgi:hypothetical protein
MADDAPLDGEVIYHIALGGDIIDMHNMVVLERDDGPEGTSRSE